MRRMSIAGFLTLGAIVAGCSTSTTDDTVAADSGRLVLWDGESIGALDNGEVVPIDTSGEISQVTAAGDGTLIWTRVDGDPPSVDAVVGSRFELATPTVPFFYEWNPTGTRVAFLGNTPSGSGLVFGLIDVEGEAVTAVESPAPFFFDWSPDGEHLIAHVGGAALGIIEAETGTIQELPEASGPFPAPLWEERGIVVVTRVGPTISTPVMPVAYQAATSTIVLIDPDDDSRTPLAEVDGPVRLFPGAESLALVGGVAGDQRIEVIGWEGSAVATLGEGTIDLAQWSPDGTTLLWTERGVDDLLTPKTWSGGEIAVHEAFRPSSVFATAYLPFWDQYDRTVSLWSPDSEAFALATTDGVSVNVVGGESSTYSGWEMGIWTATPTEG